MDVTFPVAQKDYRKYEKQEPYPVYISKEKFNDMLKLLLITKGIEQHYVLIKDFNKFMYNQTKHRERKHFCMHCLQCFRYEKALINHKENCITIAQAIKMPKADDKAHFKNYHKGLEVPFVIYADFEAINEQVHECQPNNDKSYTESYQKHKDCEYRYKVVHKGLEVPFVIYADFEAINEKVHGCQLNNDKSYTESYQKHKDCEYGYKVVCCYDDKHSKPVRFIYRGENAVHKFMEKMLEEVEWRKKMKHKHFNKDMILTKDDEENFKNAKKC